MEYLCLASCPQALGNNAKDQMLYKVKRVLKFTRNFFSQEVYISEYPSTEGYAKVWRSKILLQLLWKKNKKLLLHLASSTTGEKMVVTKDSGRMFVYSPANV